MDIFVRDFIHENETALVGRDHGRAFRKSVEERLGALKKLESQGEISIKLPRNIMTMNKSFFLGAFADRVVELGKDNFLSRYDFSSSPYIDEVIPSFADYALKSSSMRDILNG